MSPWSRLQSVLLVLAALAMAASPAAAIVAPAAQSDFTIPLPEFDDFSYRTPAADADRAGVTATLADRAGGSWEVWTWNPRSRTPHALYGSGLQVRSPFGTTEEVVATARQLIRDLPDVFRAEEPNLRVTATPVGYGKQSVHFQQTYRGLDVSGATVRMVFTEGGRLFALGSDYYRGIAVDARPSVPATVAQEIARRDLATSHGAVDPASPELLVLPVPQSQTEVEHHLAWKVKIRTEDPVGLWATYVDAHSGRILWRYNEVSFLDFAGTTSSEVQRPTYCEAPLAEPMPFLSVTVADVGSTTANAGGEWSLPYGGMDTKSVTASFEGPYVRVENQAGPTGSFTGMAVPGVPLTVTFTNDNSQPDERDVYRAVNDVHLFFQGIDPSYHYINELMPAQVSIASSCNAYYTGHTINFYAAGGGCGNTGEIMGVVHHEFCHGITEDLLGNQGTQGIGEGNSDIISNLMTGESIIGRGFYLGNCVTGIRNSENSLQYPQNLNGSIHHDGQIIAGFHWDSWQALQATLPEAEALDVAANTWHWGRVHFHPTTHVDQVLATFLADDDDGNLTNGTPHYAAFCEGAANHSYPCPALINGVVWEHDGTASRTDPGDVVVTAHAYSTEGAIVADSTLLRYRIGAGAWVALPMDTLGGPQDFTATIPGLQLGDEVEYYLRTRDLEGNTGTSPAGAPTTTWPFDIATMVDDFEEEAGWMLNAEGTDNATDGHWTQVDPHGTSLNGQPVQPENDRTPGSGTICMVTGDGPAGSDANAVDVDGGRTSLYSPLYDLSGATHADVKYWRWYTNSLGGYPNLDTWLVRVRNNGGPWIDLENTTQSANRWTYHSFDLLALFGGDLGQVQIKFVASDTGGHSAVEAAVDDLEFQTVALTSSAAWRPHGECFALLGARPNPVRTGSEIGFQVPVRTRVTIELYDVGGRRVRVLASGEFAAGLHRLAWDGHNAPGADLAGGTYYLRMQAPGFTASRTIVVTR